MPWRRFVPQLSWWTLALATLCVWTLATGVYTTFEGVRIKVVREVQAFEGDHLIVAMPDSSRWEQLESPVVVIAKLQNPTQSQANVVASLRGEELRFTLAPGGEHRLDLVMPAGVPIKVGDRLTFQVDGTSAVEDGCCLLQYLEVANLHGASTSIPSFIIVPRGSTAYTGPGWIAIVCAVPIVIWLLSRTAGVTSTHRVRWLRLALTIVVVLLFGVAMCSPLFGVRVALSFKSFLLGLIALTWPGIGRTWHELRQRVGELAPWAPAALEATVVASGVAIFYVLLAQTYLAGMGGNYSGFLVIGEQFADRVPYLTERPELKAQLRILPGVGYDAQFVYFIAFDPFLLAFKDQPARYRQMIDAPPYRYGRIGFSLLTKLFSADDPARFPPTMVWLIVAGSFAGAWCLALLAQRCGYAGWWGLLYVLVPGFRESLCVALPEAIAAAFVLGAYLLSLRGRYWLTALLLAASLLVRETGIAFVVVLAVWIAWRERQPRGGLIVAAAVVPLMLWRFYIAWRLFPDFGWNGLFFNPRTVGLPFRGFVELWGRIQAGTYSAMPEQVLAGIFFPLVLIAAFLVAAYLFWTRPSALTAAAVLYGVLAMSLSYAVVWLHMENGERATFEVFVFLLAAFVSLGPVAARTRLVMHGFVVCALLYFWFASSDAPFVRYVVLSTLS
jgi:hypothetical protein